MSNWCFSSKGTQKLALSVRGWLEGSPTKGVITDDVSAMYQFTSRWRGFEFLRRRFPHLLALFRFFYFTAAVIWFGGTTVPIDFDAGGRAVLGTAAPPPTSCAPSTAASRAAAAPPSSASAPTTRTAATRNASTPT